MKRKNEIDWLISHDCQKAMCPTVLFHTLNECLVNLLSIYIAAALGSFANSILQMNVDWGIQNMAQILICLIVLVLFMPFVDLLGRLIMLKNSLTHDRKVLNRFLNKKYESVMQYNAGDIQYRIEWDACKLRIYWVELVAKAVMICITSACLLYYSVRINTLYTVIVIAISTVKLVVPFAVQKLEGKYDRETREYSALVRTYETEVTTGSHSLKLNGLSQPLLQQLDKIYQAFFEKTYRRSVRCTIAAQNINAGLDVVCMFLVLFVGVILIADHTISAGDVTSMVGFFTVYQTVFSNIDFVIRNTPVYRNLLERTQVLYSDPEKAEGKKVESVCCIRAENLSFAYKEGLPIFQNVNFEINSGEKVVITGANGTGKSTLVKLLCAFLTGYTGSLTLNGAELSDIDMESWRNQMAYASQEAYLFEGTVAENILAANPCKTEKDVQKLMERLQIDYLSDRKVSIGQDNLSGGEKQKISIARALIKGTSFLILDEPSNHLDVQTFQWLQNFIRTYPKTILYISHDPEMIKLADRKICLEA